MNLKKWMCGFFALLLTSFMHISHAKRFEYDEIYGLLAKSIPQGVDSEIYCVQRSVILAQVISILKTDSRFRSDFSFAKKVVLRIFITSICACYSQNSKCYCKAEESGIIADSCDYSELIKNLDNMVQVYSDLSVEC